MEVENNTKVNSADQEAALERGRCRNPDFATLIKTASLPHIDSFNFAMGEGLARVVKYIRPLEIVPQEAPAYQKEGPFYTFKRMKVWYQEVKLGYPTKKGDVTAKESRLFPDECRISSKSYSAPLFATIARTIDDGPVETIKMNLSDIPVMVRSSFCHLAKLSNKELVEQHEDCNEFGGYFIINGLEKLVRMLITPKKNYPVAFMRPSVKKKNSSFTGHIVQMKCMRDDLYSKNLSLYYTSDGNICLGVVYRKQEFLIPVIVLLKALLETTDVQIYNKLVKGNATNSEISDRVEVLLRVSKSLSLHSKDQCLSYLGSRFRGELNLLAASDVSDKEVGKIFMDELICVHCSSSLDKFNSLLGMIDKLYALVGEKIQPDNLDSLINQDVLLSGHLYLMLLKEKLEEALDGVKQKVHKDSQKATDAVRTRDINYLRKAFETQSSIGSKLEYTLSTGNLRSQSGLDLQQQSGFAIIADKLNNMRYLSHFRSIHRGAFFAEMKTTTVRKLLPENWGFICPVHTPDGGPCGLLNHLSRKCHIVTEPQLTIEHSQIAEICCSLGMSSAVDLSCVYPFNYLKVTLDGKLIGMINPEKAEEFVQSLRYLKVMQVPSKLVPQKMEIGYIPPSPFHKGVQYPGIFLYTVEARFMRPVKNLALNQVEWIGPLEQIYLSIACVEEDIRQDTTHQELDPSYTLSILAGQVPFLNYNQSPRNMYQCQMAKQTMGTPYHNHPYRFDNKIYRILNPQAPLVKCDGYDEYGMADYPSGTNAIVAVISYTGYDMEDAMILNKSSYERGFGHGVVYKSYMKPLNELASDTGSKGKSRFRLMSSLPTAQRNNLRNPALDNMMRDGIPNLETSLKKGTPELCVYDSLKDEVKVFRSKDNEPAKLEQVALVSNESNPNDVSVLYKIRFQRNPIIGDKFSSRHGQKGVLSVLWPHVDMPFTETGITPDVIINPHAFPSRMTIGMLIESMAGKTGALEGKFQTTTAFQNYENDNVVDYFGTELKKAGYNYYGNETMYSGIYGTPLKCDIYIGVVYYQRLRHMVSDKYQARATGPVDVLTQQPVKGRKKQGGIRVGEMERDSFLSHGISYVLHDRLLNCSDRSEGLVCLTCGSILSTYNTLSSSSANLLPSDEVLRNPSTDKYLMKREAFCRVCNDNKCSKVVMPFVLRYLTNELAGMNIKLTFKTK